MSPLILVGAGGHARETLAVVAACRRAGLPRPVLGFVDDDPEAAIDGCRHLGAASADNILRQAPGAEIVLAIGDPTTRRRVADRLGEIRPAGPLVHPAATVGDRVALGPGAIVAAGARLTTDVVTGAHVHLNPNVVVSHDCVLGDFVSCSPGVLLSGEVRIGDRVLLGSGAVVLPGCHIGDDVTVGAGAVVTADVASGSTVVGVPARSTHER